MLILIISIHKSQTQSTIIKSATQTTVETK
jgi:hypothetical protein